MPDTAASPLPFPDDPPGDDSPGQRRRLRVPGELRDRARALRGEGRSYGQIAREVPVSKSTLSLRLRDLPVPDPDRAAQARAASARRWPLERRRRNLPRQQRKFAAALQIGPLSDRELLIAGVVAYWAEGAKDKSYDRRERLIFINSDVALIRLFLRWLDLVGVPESARRYRVHVHETTPPHAAQQAWVDRLGLDPDAFLRPTIKRHRAKTVRRNTDSGYKGCLAVTVRGSAELYQRVEGWWGGIAVALDRAPGRWSTDTLVPAIRRGVIGSTQSFGVCGPRSSRGGGASLTLETRS